MNWEYDMGYSRQKMKKDLDLYHPVKPITPAEVVDKKKDILPSFVIEAFNEIIAKNYSGNSSKFKQDDVIEAILNKMPFDEGCINQRTVNRQGIFDNHWLDVEDIYIGRLDGK